MSALPIEEFVTCQICFEVYKEPQSLSCRHTLCKKCVRKLRRGSKIQCPMCQTYSDTKDIKPDFNIVSLIDLYIQQEKDLFHDRDEQLNNPKLCHTCKDSTKTVTAMCVDCKQFMCKDCEAAHKGIPSLKKHSIKTILEVAEEIKNNLKTTKTKLLHTEEGLAKRANKVLAELNRLNSAEEEVIVLIDKSEEGYVEQVVSHYEGLRDRVKQVKQEEREKLKVIEKQVHVCVCEVRDKVGVVTELLAKDDPTALIETGRAFSQDLSSGSSDEKLPSEAEIEAQFTVEITEGGGFEPYTAGQLDIYSSTSRARYDSPDRDPQSPQRSGNYTTMSTGQYDNRKSVPLDVPSKRLQMIRDYLWCVGTNVLKIYNRNLQLVKTVQLENVTNATAVVQMDSSKMLVTCSVKKALQVLDAQGKFEATVTKGCFSDIARVNHLVYVLDYNHCKVYIFRTVAGGLHPSKMFKLRYSNGGDCDTLCVKDKTIYVGSWHNNCIYLHSENGDPIAQFGKSGSVGPGLMKSPRICSIDNTGNLLVADCGNHRFQVYDVATGTWKVICHEELTIGWPYDAVVDEGVKYMWVLDYKSVMKLRKQDI